MADNTTSTGAELASMHLEVLGMRQLPLCPWRLARRSGIDFRFHAGRSVLLPNGILKLDNSVSDQREQGATLARAVAKLLLLPHDIRSDAEVERAARELLLPGGAVARLANRLRGDYEAIAAALPHAPELWVADAVDDMRAEGLVELPLLRPIVNVTALPLREPVRVFFSFHR
jgi:hypothetical protein